MKLECVFKVDQLLEELGMDVLDALDALVVDLRLQVLLRDLLA